MDFSNFEEVVKFAIQREEDAIQSYGNMLDKTRHPGLKKLLRELQDEERNHKKLLEELTLEELDGYESREVPDLKISDFLEEEPVSENVTFQDLLIFAAKNEQKAVELYTRMKECAKTAQAEKLFDYLIEQEKNHKLKLETEYDQYVYEED